MSDRMTDEQLAEIEQMFIEYFGSTESPSKIDNCAWSLLQALKAERDDRDDWFHLQQTFERQLNEYIDKVKRRDNRISKLEAKLERVKKLVPEFYRDELQEALADE